MSALTFNAVYEDAGEGWIYAHVPEPPEVQTQGKDLDKAREMVRDAIETRLGRASRTGRADPREELCARRTHRSRYVKKRELELTVSATAYCG